MSKLTSKENEIQHKAVDDIDWVWKTWLFVSFTPDGCFTPGF